jgi:hypothetical protein
MSDAHYVEPWLDSRALCMVPLVTVLEDAIKIVVVNPTRTEMPWPNIALQLCW